MKSGKKKYLQLLFMVMLCAVLLLSSTVLEAKSKRKAKPSGIPAQLSTLNLKVGGREFDSYDIPGYVIDYKSYYRLTDLAQLLSNTYSRFNIVWSPEKMRTELIKHTLYRSPAEAEWDYPEELIYVQPASAPIEVENVVQDLHGFLYKGEFYVPLEETMAMINVKVKWMPESLSLKLISEIPENVFPLDKEDWEITSNIIYDARWASPKQNFMFYQEGHYFLIYTSSYRDSKEDGSRTSEVVIKKLSPAMEVVDTFSLPYQGEIFGGFYHGREHNYFLFGNNNPKEKNDTTILKLVKTNHQFKPVASLDIKNTYTTKPFEGGSVSMSEWKDTLVIHTARERYRTEDGLNHQSQLTVVVDSKLMKVLNAHDLGRFQINHVSHSFNQFAIHDKQNGDLFLVDHGDGYPRAVVVTKLDSASRQVKKEANIIPIPGEIGANQTGVFIGGVEQSRDNILVAVNQIDYGKAKSFDSYTITGEDVSRRDVYLYTINKNLTNGQKKSLKLTDYSREEGVYYSVPKIVAIGEDKFFLIWQKKRINENISDYETELQYTIVNGNGQIIKAITTLPWYGIGRGDLLYQDGYVWWQVRQYIQDNHDDTTIYRVKVKE